MTEPSGLKVFLRNLVLRTTLAIILKQHLLNRFQLKVISNWYCTDGQNFGLKKKAQIHQSYINGNRKDSIILWEMLNNHYLTIFGLNTYYPIPKKELDKLVELVDGNLKKINLNQLLDDWNKKTKTDDITARIQYEGILEIVDELKKPKNMYMD